MVSHDRDRRVARDRLAAEQRRLRHARLAEQMMPLATFYRRSPRPRSAASRPRPVRPRLPLV